MCALLSANIPSFVTHHPRVYAHMRVYVCVRVCVFRRGGGGCSAQSRWPGRLLYYFWEGCPFPLEGLIEECWLSPSPPSQAPGVRPSPALGARWRQQWHRTLPDLRPVHGPGTRSADGWAAYWRWSPLVFSKWISAALLTGCTLLKE